MSGEFPIHLPECPQLKVMRVNGLLFFAAVSHVAESFREENPH